MPSFLSVAALALVGVALACQRAEPTRSAASVASTTTTDDARLDSLILSDDGAVAMPADEVARLVAEDPLWETALRIHFDALTLDGHIDTPTLMVDRGYQLAERHRRAHVDLPRMVEGGLDAAFFSVYVSRRFGEGQAATDRALRLIEEIGRQVSETDAAALAYSARDVVRIREAGQRAILLGLEGGHALQGDPAVLRLLAGNGVRYVTLTHTNTNAWADASTDAARWDGLNTLGREMVAEMNRLGVLVDLSHVSDATFYDALEVTRAPVILSHSSCRALRRHARNVTDEMLRALADNGGIIMINFYRAHVGRGRVTVDSVLDHIDHAVSVAGVDHVGLGSDFDGVPRLPDGLGDVTRLPYLTYGLLKRGYAEEDVRKILGGNALRVLADAARIAEGLREE